MSSPIVPKEGWDKIPLTETEQEVLKLIQDRHILGRKKYGCGISFKQGTDPVQWVVEALDEVGDLVQYLTALKLLMKDMKKKGVFYGYNQAYNYEAKYQETFGAIVGRKIDSSVRVVRSFFRLG